MSLRRDLFEFKTPARETKERCGPHSTRHNTTLAMVHPGYKQPVIDFPTIVHAVLGAHVYHCILGTQPVDKCPAYAKVQIIPAGILESNLSDVHW